MNRFRNGGDGPDRRRRNRRGRAGGKPLPAPPKPLQLPPAGLSDEDAPLWNGVSCKGSHLEPHPPIKVDASDYCKGTRAVRLTLTGQWKFSFRKWASKVLLKLFARVCPSHVVVDMRVEPLSCPLYPLQPGDPLYGQPYPTE